MRSIFLAILLLTLIFACRTDGVRTPEELEKWIYANTTYHAKILNCQVRANIAHRWLLKNGYESEIRVQRLPDGRFHAYIVWTKDGTRSQILCHSAGGMDHYRWLERQRANG